MCHKIWGSHPFILSDCGKMLNIQLAVLATQSFKIHNFNVSVKRPSSGNYVLKTLHRKNDKLHLFSSFYHNYIMRCLYFSPFCQMLDIMYVTIHFVFFPGVLSSISHKCNKRLTDWCTGVRNMLYQ